MSDAALNIFVRVVKRRIDVGETLSDVLDSYPKLTDEEKEQIQEEVQSDGEML